MSHDITQGREVEQRVQQVKEQEWSKIASLQQDKIQLEEDLTKAQQHNATFLSSQHVMADKHRDEMRQLLADKVANHAVTRGSCDPFIVYSQTSKRNWMR